ncbi:Asp/Glu/hydantoin racemase [Rhodococcus sp. 1R11]|uniref:Aspartate/glutamate racemase family protein n=1 Tax=Rhodococcus ruber TaxID=1830 RepID=A0ABT4MCZ0_9NOCA|nr:MULTISPECIES: aspartate/glutamate racemase family protein [Rhodococcus]MCZ4518849.1 aspartate/glutamate racemase family protein [Rhodococcus ruber]TFI40162.1 Asp/Glu/hydantoin racemase [Rhodococcus sp. 1R11]
MTRRVVLLHTVSGLLPVFGELGKGLPADVKVSNIVDESLLADALAEGALTASISRRVVDHVISAVDSGAVAVMATCSSIGPAVELAAQLVDVPVLRVDVPMVDAAIESAQVAAGTERAPRIAVLATAKSTLSPTVDLVRRRAQDASVEPELEVRLLSEAFAANASGDTARHDAIIAEALRDLAESVDSIVLAQASMARVAAIVSNEGLTTPTFSSPGLAMGRLASVLEHA